MSALSPLEAAFQAGEPPLKDWPADERPRERLVQGGVRALGDAELIALLLRTGAPGGSPLALARRIQQLAAAQGGLAKLDLSDLQALPGMGLVKAASILAALELGRRQALPGPEMAPLSSARAVYQALQGLLEGRRECGRSGRPHPDAHGEKQRVS